MRKQAPVGECTKSTTTIADVIGTQVKRWPDRPAMFALGREPLSFGSLSQHITSIREQSNLLGIGRGDVVAIVMPNGAEMATATLVTAITASCAPLNPEYRKEEFEFFFGELRPKALMIASGMSSPARAVAAKLSILILELDIAEHGEAGVFEMRPSGGGAPYAGADVPGPDDIALLLHTSGTTSRPKLVPLTQRNILTTAANLTKAIAIDEHDVCLNVMPQFHIGGLVDLLVSPLSVGCSVVFTPRFSAPHLPQIIREYRPTWMQVVPTMLQSVFDQFKSDPGAFLQKGDLKFIRCVAAALPIDLQKAFEEVFGIPVIEVYGMTETTTLIATNPLPPGRRKFGSVGCAAGPNVAIVDSTGDTVPLLQAGEVVVRGDSIMSGYMNAPQANTESFFGDWFRTGDRGYLDEDGYLFLTGRIKEIVNRGGEKISPSEVDDILKQHPKVADAATFGVYNEHLGEDIAAAIVEKAPGTLTKNELLRFARERIAYFKVPKDVYFVDSLPKTQNGKVQRTLLSERFDIRERASGLRANQGQSQSSVSDVIARMWAEVLEVESVQADDDFFDRGGDSFKALTFINSLTEQGGEGIFVTAIFDAPTVAEFEAFLRREHPQVCERLPDMRGGSVRLQESE